MDRENYSSTQWSAFSRKIRLSLRWWTNFLFLLGCCYGSCQFNRCFSQTKSRRIQRMCDPSRLTIEQSRSYPARFLKDTIVSCLCRLSPRRTLTSKITPITSCLLLGYVWSSYVYCRTIHLQVIVSLVTMQKTRVLSIRWSIGSKSSERMSGYYSEQSSRTIEIEESPTFQCTQCCSLRSDQSDHSHGLWIESVGSGMQSTRSIPAESRNKYALLGVGKHVSVSGIGVLTRSSEETSGNCHQRFESKRDANHRETNIVVV